MTTLIQILTAAALILTIVIPFIAWYCGEHTKQRYKKALAVYDYPGSKKKDITKAKEQFESIDSL